MCNQVSKVALLNDQFRRSGQGVTLTCDVAEIADLSGLMKKVRSFKEFNKNNDPWNEHDFGRLNWKGERVFWKIDYFNKTLDEWEDPLSPDCKRLMTVMLAEDY